MASNSADDSIQYPPGFGLRDVIGWGTTGLVVHDQSSGTIIKVPIDPGDDACMKRMRREQEVYERIRARGGHRSVLRYEGSAGSGIRLEYAPSYNLRAYNEDHLVGLALKMRWATQIAEALSFVHSAGVIHGDLTCANVFLDSELNAKLGDFAGSSLDGSPLLVLVTESHEFPGPLISIHGDMFALGCVLFEIMTGNAPYEGLDETEIKSRYAHGDFPNTDSLENIGGIMQKCWHGHYGDAQLVADDLRGTFGPR